MEVPRYPLAERDRAAPTSPAACQPVAVPAGQAQPRCHQPAQTNDARRHEHIRSRDAVGAATALALTILLVLRRRQSTGRSPLRRHPLAPVDRTRDGRGTDHGTCDAGPFGPPGCAHIDGLRRSRLGVPVRGAEPGRGDPRHGRIRRSAPTPSAPTSPAWRASATRDSSRCSGWPSSPRASAVCWRWRGRASRPRECHPACSVRSPARAPRSALRHREPGPARADAIRRAGGPARRRSPRAALAPVALGPLLDPRRPSLPPPRHPAPGTRPVRGPILPVARPATWPWKQPVTRPGAPLTPRPHSRPTAPPNPGQPRQDTVAAAAWCARRRAPMRHISTVRATA